MTRAYIKKYLLGLAVFLLLLPLLATFSAFLTYSLDTSGWYKPVEKYVVPFEAGMVRSAIGLFGIRTMVYQNSTKYEFVMLKDAGNINVDLAWNCLGWQSMLVLAASLIAGLHKKYTAISRIECVVIGIAGTLLINILRMSFIALGSFYLSDIFVYLLHDYFAVVIGFFWLLFFWWFSYAFILEERISE